MSDEIGFDFIELKARVKSHMYSVNPLISQYLDTRSKTYDVSILERTSICDDINEQNYALIPISDNRTDYDCCICLSLAKTPVRCARPEQVVVHYDFDADTDGVYHYCCYTCITFLMLLSKKDNVPCPTCRVNHFHLDNLFSANKKFINAAENYVTSCENGCGLFGSPLALSHHICPLSDSQRSGHTITSNRVHLLVEDNEKLKQEFREMAKNYHCKTGRAKYWKSKYKTLEAMNNELINDMSFMSSKLLEKETVITHLKQCFLELQSKKEFLEKVSVVEKKRTENKFKEKLKIVKKIYETRIEEEIDKNIRLTEEKRRLAANPLVVNAIHAQTQALRDNSTEFEAKADNSRVENISKDAKNAVVFYKSRAYNIPKYNPETISIIELKKLIRFVVPDLDEDQYELYNFQFTRIREDENTNRYVYSENKLRPLYTCVRSDSPTLTYLPKNMTQIHNEHISITINCNDSRNDSDMSYDGIDLNGNQRKV